MAKRVAYATEIVGQRVGVVPSTGLKPYSGGIGLPKRESKGLENIGPMILGMARNIAREAAGRLWFIVITLLILAASALLTYFYYYYYVR
jgi:hypothetical protein